MAKLDAEDRDYIARMILGGVRAIVNGDPFGSRLGVDPNYTEPERSLKDVMDRLAAIERGDVECRFKLPLKISQTD